MKTLDFSQDKVQQLTLDELRRTYRENLITGDPVGGIYHFDLIERVLDIFANAGLRTDVQEIFAADNRDSRRPGVTLLPQIEAVEGEKSLGAHLLRRVYANIAVRDDETEVVVTNLAVAYHQRGIQVGIGPMVKVCHNQTILGAQDVAANYQCWGGARMKGDERGLDALLRKVESWAQLYDSQQGGRSDTVRRMQEAVFTRRQLYQTIGVLTEKRILHDTEEKLLRNGKPYPLNSAQINATTESLLLLADLTQPLDRTFWDAYQCLNSVLKPAQMDIPQVLPQSLALFETLNEIMLGHYD